MNQLLYTRDLPLPALVVLALLVALPACGQPDTPPPDEFFETLYFEPVATGNRAAVGDTTEIILRDPADWSTFSEGLDAIGKIAPVDFEQMMVIAAVVPANSGGYAVTFDSVDLIEGEIVATYTLSTPGLDCLTFSALTQPFQAIAARKASGEIRFIRKTKRESCSTR